MKDYYKWIPIYVALIAACVALYGNYSTNKNTLEVEKRQFESNLILKSLIPNDSAQSITNIKFLIKAGFITKDNEKLINIIRDPKYQIQLPKWDTVTLHPNNSYKINLSNVPLFSAQITDERGQPLSEVEVTTFSGPYTGVTYSITKSDKNGLFKVPIPNNGNYVKVMIDHVGYQRIIKKYLRGTLSNLRTIPLSKQNN